MRSSILLTCLFVSLLVSGQSEYFNVIQSESWNTSSCTNVEVRTDGYLVAGSNNINGSGTGTYVQLWNLDGILNEHFYQTASLLLTNYAESMNVVEDGVIYGWGNSSAHAAKLSVQGEVEWALEISDSLAYNTEFFFSYGLIDGGYLFPGTKPYDTDDEVVYAEYGEVYLVKTNSLGEIIWESQFPLDPEKFVRINGAHELENGDILLTGAVMHPWDPVIVRIDSEGNHLSTWRWGDEEFQDWMPWAVLNENNELIVSHQIGRGENDLNGFDEYSPALSIYSLESDSIVWTYESEEVITYYRQTDFIVTEDGGYAVLGFKISGGLLRSFITKYYSDLTLEWEKEYVYDLDYEQNRLYDIENTPDGGFICAGKVLGDNPNTHPQQLWLLKLDACGDPEWQGCGVGVEELSETPALLVYPNPASSEITISLNPEGIPSQSYLNGNHLGGSSMLDVTEIQITDLLGRVVHVELVNFRSSLAVSLSHLTAGAYVVSLLHDGREFISEKLIVE